MNRQIILKAIEPVIDQLNYYVKYREVTLSEEDKAHIKTAYVMLFPNKAYSYTSACGGCVKEAMNVLQSFYQRESAIVEEHVEATVVPKKVKSAGKQSL